MSERIGIDKSFWFSEPDKKDYKYRVGASKWQEELPSKHFQKEFTEGIEDQKNTNSCSGNAICSALEFWTKSKTGLSVDYSRLFSYWTARNEQQKRTGEKIQDTGAYLKDSLIALKKYGIAEETHWPFLTPNINLEPDNSAYRNAKTHQITRYEKIRGIRAIKFSLLESLTPIIGIKVNDDFLKLKGSFRNQKDNYCGIKSGDKVFGHAMIIVGWDDELGGFILENSFSSDWGYHGFGFIDYSIFKRDNMETWVIKSLSPNIENIKKNLPSTYCQVKKKITKKITQWKNIRKDNGCIFL